MWWRGVVYGGGWPPDIPQNEALFVFNHFVQFAVALQESKLWKNETKSTLRTKSGGIHLDCPVVTPKILHAFVTMKKLSVYVEEYTNYRRLIFRGASL